MSDESVLVLTGVTGLVGRHLAQHFLARGQTVVGTARKEPDLENCASAFGALPGNFVPIAIDLLTADIGAFVQDLHHRNLAPTFLINNARNIENLWIANSGLPQRRQWVAEFELGVSVPAELIWTLAGTENSRLTSVVNIASMYGIVTATPALYDDPRNMAPMHYGVAKAALIHLTKEMAVRLAPRGVRVNAVSYGGIEGRADEAFAARYKKLAPLERMLRLDEVHAPVEFLLSAGASGMTGHNLVVDGGWTLW